MRSNPNSPIVALDVDGTLGDYHSHFLKFAQEWYGRPMPAASEINPGLPLHKFMQTSKSTYRKCKLAYRQGGLERSMPAYPGARELAASIRKSGAEVWVATTRPYLKYDQLYSDTLHWLRRHRIQYDAVIHGPNKYREINRIAGESRSGPGISRVAAVLDDLPEMIEQANGLGMPALLRDQPYNRHYDADRVLNLVEAHDRIGGMLRKWYWEQNG